MEAVVLINIRRNQTPTMTCSDKKKDRIVQPKNIDPSKKVGKVEFLQGAEI